MPARGGSSGRISGGSGGSSAGGARGGGPTRAQNRQSAAARTYITKNPNRVEAGKKAYEARVAAAKAATRKKVAGGIASGAAAGAAVSFATTKGSEGPKKSVPVAKKAAPKKMAAKKRAK